MKNQSKLCLGDCQDILPTFKPETMDLMVTDPPYGMSFMGKDWDKAVPSVEIWKACFRTLKPGAFAFVMSTARQECLAHMIVNLGDAGFNVAFSSIYWTYASGFPKAQNLSKTADNRAGVEREVIGKKQYASSAGNNDNFGIGKQKTNIHKREITVPVTSAAKVLDGAYSGCQLKPAVEIVIVAMKPIEEKTYLDQALKNGHGCTYLDNCRIPYKDAQKEDLKRGRKNSSFGFKKYAESVGGNSGLVGKDYDCPNGRFPANVLCEDNVLDDGIERKSGAVLTHHKRSGNSNLGETFKIRDRSGEFADWKSNSGEFSRFFSLDAWFGERIKRLPKEVQKTFPWLIIPKPGKSEKNKYTEDVKGSIAVKNNHPTIKPVKLMSFLITLGSREGDIVLDPFLGSGTTYIAATALNRFCKGIEINKEYYDKAVERCNLAQRNISAYF